MKQMECTQNIEKFQRILTEAKGNSLDVYGALYKICFESKENIALLFKILFENQNPVGTEDEAPQSITSQEAKEIHDLYYESLRKKVQKLVEMNDTKEVFYQNLWKNVFESAIAPDSDAKRAICLKILNEEIPVLPYYQAKNLVQMTDEVYAQKLKKLTPQIQEMIFIINRNFSQKTEETSQLYRIIKELSEEDAAVYLAALLTYYRTVYLRQGRLLAQKEQEEKSLNNPSAE